MYAITLTKCFACSPSARISCTRFFTSLMVRAVAWPKSALCAPALKDGSLARWMRFRRRFAMPLR